MTAAAEERIRQREKGRQATPSIELNLPGGLIAGLRGEASAILSGENSGWKTLAV